MPNLAGITGQIDVKLGTTGTTIVYSTGIFALATTPKSDVPWSFDITLVCRAVGTVTTTTLFPMGPGFQSSAIAGAGVATVGGNGRFQLPTTAPAVGGGFDNTALNVLDILYTQSGAGQLTANSYIVQTLNQ